MMETATFCFSHFFRQHIKTLSRCLLVAILIILVQGWIIHSKAKAQIQGDVELLKTAAEKYCANLEKLKTWRGEVKWFQKGANSSRHESSNIECSIDFACDLTLPAKRWSIKIDKQINVKDGQEKILRDQWTYSLQRDGTYYDLLYDSKTKDSHHIAYIKDKPYMKPGLNYGSFDPLYYYNVLDQNVETFCTTLYKNANLENMSAYSITKEENIVIIKLKRKTDPQPSTVYQIDLSKGSNFTKIESFHNSDNSSQNSIKEWIWQEISGMWVPKEFTMDHIVILPNPKEEHYRITWLKNEVNISLSKDEFSLVKLGLRQGDQVQDSRTHSSYTITDNSFPPPYNAKPAEQTK